MLRCVIRGAERKFMFNRPALATALVLAAAAVSFPAMAQDNVDGDGFDRDSHFNGAYISAFGGISIPKSRAGDAIVFDRNNDGVYGDTVITSTGANAFSPGFCDGQSTSTANSACNDDTSKGEYGARIGYDSRMGNLVVGGLLEVNKSNATDFTSAFSTTPAAYQLGRKLDYGISARARLGFTPGGGALFYATGGGTYAKINHMFATTNTANAFTEVNDDKMVWGWQAGGGAEVMLTNKVSVGIEFLHTRYTDNKYSVNVAQGSALTTNPFVLGGGTTNLRPSETGFFTNTIRGSLSFHF
jgi:outer membrane immunogenic protein